jgi:hypothetical protein
VPDIRRVFQDRRSKYLFAVLTLALVTLWPLAAPVLSQSLRRSHTFFLRAHGGLSSYIGDNNTLPFSTAAFGVNDKFPYSAGFDLGYQFDDRWAAGFGAQFADYPIITRFGSGRDISRDPTVRRTYEIKIRYMPGASRLSPYLNFGFHMTFGDVTIFEARKIQNGEPLNQQSHYVYGPVLGVGLDYAVNPVLSIIADITSHVTLMDDSVDGRLPLGPPQPANLKENNRFGTFDLLSAVQLGIVLRPFCGDSCRDSRPGRRKGGSGVRKRSSVRVSRLSDNGNTNVGYYYAVRSGGHVLVGTAGRTRILPDSPERIWACRLCIFRSPPLRLVCVLISERLSPFRCRINSLPASTTYSARISASAWKDAICSAPDEKAYSILMTESSRA